MTNVLITGANGFVGRNLVTHLEQRKDVTLQRFDKERNAADLERMLAEADVVFHLAGVNRPEDPSEFATGNTGLTEQICTLLRRHGRAPAIVFSSSTQAALPNPYGASKLAAEEALRSFAQDTGAAVHILRLRNLFGKWCRPNYNAVTATFCHNLANDLPIQISNPAHVVDLSYIDDVVAAFASVLDGASPTDASIPSHSISLGELAGRLQAFHDMRESLVIPDFTEPFSRALYATYLSYVPQQAREQGLTIRSDNRGSLAEFIKQTHLGQIFVSHTHPGITRGNHYHHTKTEKFFVVAGEGLIRMRSILGGPVQEYRVTGTAYQVIDIPPGYTHSITNVGSDEMVTLFWSSEIFDPAHPDTYFLDVDAVRDSVSETAVPEAAPRGSKA